MSPITDFNQEPELLDDGSLSKEELSGLLFIWGNVQEIVDAANEEITWSCNDPMTLPQWLSQPRGKITADVFRADLLAYLAQIGGEVKDENVLTPISPMQSFKICKRLGQIEMDPFIQACMKNLPPHTHIASLVRLRDDEGIQLDPVNFEAPPSAFHQVFY